MLFGTFFSQTCPVLLYLSFCDHLLHGPSLSIGDGILPQARYLQTLASLHPAPIVRPCRWSTRPRRETLYCSHKLLAGQSGPGRGYFAANRATYHARVNESCNITSCYGGGYYHRRPQFQSLVISRGERPLLKTLADAAYSLGHLASK